MNGEARMPSDDWMYGKAMLQEAGDDDAQAMRRSIESVIKTASHATLKY